MLNLVRHYFDSKYTIGKLYLNDIYVCDTLEPSLCVPHPCISTGTYHVRMMPSQKFACKMPFIVDPPVGRSGILFHAGNSPKDTLGCILVGYNDIIGGLLNSKRAFAWLKGFVSAFDVDVLLTIKNK